MAIVVLGTIQIIQEFIGNDSVEFHTWIALLFLPLVIYIFVFIIQTGRITFSDEGITLYWKIGFGPIKLWEQTKYHLKWPEVDRVYSFFPVWIPIHAIGVIGYQDSRKMRNFYLGALMTKKKESLVYIADHVKPGVIDQEVQKLIDKYRTQLEKKQAA